MGLQGPHHRRKLASTFLRPATWAEYCTEVSFDNCASRDSHSTRAPEPEERNLYFVEGQFTGYFRATEKNDCDSYPSTCTGLILDWPCGWESFVQAQVYHLDIALEPVLYSYAELLQIISAANATKSNIIFKWWTPTVTFDEYFGTDMEFTRVSLPSPTQKCTDSRVDRESRCSDSFAERVGSPEGACDDQPVLLRKVLSTGFEFATQSPDLDEALWSPAYEFVRNIKISSLQLTEISQNWIQQDVDKWNYDPREATCRWVVENIDTIQAYLPESYPRKIRNDSGQSVAWIVVVTVSSLTLLVVLASFVYVYRARWKKAIKRAQIEFVYLYGVGLLNIAMSSLFTLFPNGRNACVAMFWLDILGHIWIFALLDLKIDAINRYLNSGKILQRVMLSLQQLSSAICISCGCGAIVLLLWTIFQTIDSAVVYQLSDESSQSGMVEVSASRTCVIPHIEQFAAFGAQGFLLLYGLSLGFFLSRRKEDVNSTKSLTVLAAAHGVFATFRFLLFLVGDEVEPTSAVLSESFLLSFECLVGLAIFLLPKLLDRKQDESIIDGQTPDLFLNTVSQNTLVIWALLRTTHCSVADNHVGRSSRIH